MSVDFVTNQEIIVAARRNLRQNVWDISPAAPSLKQPCGVTAWVSIVSPLGREF